MIHPFLSAQLTLLVFVSVCALSDYLTGRIPNRLILCGLLCAAVARAGTLPDNADSLLPCLSDMASGFLLPYLLLGALVFLKMLGAGDVKLLSVIGLQLGRRGSLAMMWYSLLMAAGMSAVLVMRRGNLAQRLEYLYRYIGQAAVRGKPGSYRDPSAGYTESGEFAFAVPVFLALVVYISVGVTPASIGGG